MGGSLGAKALDRAFAAIAPAFKQRGLSIRHQARSESIDFLRRAYDEQLLHAEVVPFIEDVIAAYTWADLIVARAGASTVVELALVNRPVIFVPLKARGDHQILNARVMVEQGKALMVAEGDDFERRLLEAIDFYIDQQNYMRCVEAPMHQRNADGAERIARAVILGVKRVPIN
jgi:UDP-N-acetylglucosamine--N-acetylmuramyl-(pentapeptide) pyrophosphoryl-undecaprenol N-acetylglucosamine transferase